MIFVLLSLRGYDYEATLYLHHLFWPDCFLVRFLGSLLGYISLRTPRLPLCSHLAWLNRFRIRLLPGVQDNPTLEGSSRRRPHCTFVHYCWLDIHYLWIHSSLQRCADGDGRYCTGFVDCLSNYWPWWRTLRLLAWLQSCHPRAPQAVVYVRSPVLLTLLLCQVHRRARLDAEHLSARLFQAFEK
jgi:hypothetical protein